MKVHHYDQMMAYLTRQRFSNGGGAILPKPNPLSQEERNQKVFNDYVGRMKHYLTGAEMPEWFVKDLITKKAEELGVELKADGGRMGFADGPPGITEAAQKRKEKLHIKKYGKVLNPTEARSKGWEKRINKPHTVKGLEEIRAELVAEGKTVTQRNGKFIFADITEQAAFDNEIDKKYKVARTSTGGKQTGVLTHKQIYDQFLKGHYSEKGIHELMARHKNANDLEYKALSDDQKQAHKVKRDNLIKKYQSFRVSGTVGHQAHHLYSLGDEFDVRTKDIVIIPKKVNARLQNNNRILLDISQERIKLLSDVNVDTAKNIEAELKAIDAKAEKVISDHYKKFPDDDGLLKYRKINAILSKDGSISFAKGNSIGGDSSRWIHKDMNKNVNQLNTNEKRIFREYLLNKAKEADLKVTDKTKSSSTKPQIWARKILDKGQGLWSKLPMKNFRLMPSGALAATDFTIMSLMGVPPATAAVGSLGWLTKKPELSKAFGTQAQTMGFMDEMNQKKAEDNLAAAERLKIAQSTAKDIEPFELDEKEEVVTENKPIYGPIYADQIKKLKIS